jgi:hypothetical protein
MDEEKMSRKLLHGRMERRRRRGRPRKSWLQNFEKDLRVMQVGRWWEKAQSKGQCRRILKEVKANPGL